MPAPFRFRAGERLGEALGELGIVVRAACAEAITKAGMLILDQDTMAEPGTVWTRDARPPSLLMHSYCRSPLGGKLVTQRYCSVGRNVRVMGFGHPTDRITSSPITYESRRSGAEWAHLGQNAVPAPVRSASGRVSLGNDVWIGEGALLKPGLNLGTGCIIGAEAVVTHDVQPYSVMAGNPARAVKARFPASTVERLLALRWWEFDLTSISGFSLGEPAERAIDNLMELEASGQARRLDPARTPLWKVLLGLGVETVDAT